MRDAEWWPLGKPHYDRDGTTEWKVTIHGKGHTVRHNHDGTGAHYNGWLVFPKPPGGGGDIVVHVQDKLELRAALLAYAYPEGNP